MNRELSESKDMEMQLKSRYVKDQVRKQKEIMMSQIMTTVIWMSRMVMMVFAGVTEVNIASNKNTTNGEDILGATNITPV